MKFKNDKYKYLIIKEIENQGYYYSCNMPNNFHGYSYIGAGNNTKHYCTPIEIKILKMNYEYNSNLKLLTRKINV